MLRMFELNTEFNYGYWPRRPSLTYATAVYYRGCDIAIDVHKEFNVVRITPSAYYTKNKICVIILVLIQPRIMIPNVKVTHSLQPSA